MIRRMLDDLYWVMSYSRWSDGRFWPLFRDAFRKTHPAVSPDSLEAARTYNFQRYYYQGIGRYEPDAVYERGVADIETLANIKPTVVTFSDQSPPALTPPLRIYRQYLLLCDRHAAEGARPFLPRPREALQRHAYGCFPIAFEQVRLGLAVRMLLDAGGGDDFVASPGSARVHRRCSPIDNTAVHGWRSVL